MEFDGRVVSGTESAILRLDREPERNWEL